MSSQGRKGADHGAESVRGDIGDGGKARREEEKLGELDQDRDQEADGGPAPPQPRRPGSGRRRHPTE